MEVNYWPRALIGGYYTCVAATLARLQLIIFLITHRLITSFFRVRVVRFCVPLSIIHAAAAGEFARTKRDDDDDGDCYQELAVSPCVSR
jgi:hypothetical protein